MLVFDREKQKFFELNSSEEFDSKVVEHICDKVTRLQFQRKRYTNADHSLFCQDKFGKDSGAEEDDFDNEDHNSTDKFLKLKPEDLTVSRDKLLQNEQTRLKEFDELMKKFIIPEKQTKKYQD